MSRWSPTGTRPPTTSCPPTKRLKEPHDKQVDDEKFLAAACEADLKLYTVMRHGDHKGMTGPERAISSADLETISDPDP